MIPEQGLCLDEYELLKDHLVVAGRLLEAGVFVFRCSSAVPLLAAVAAWLCGSEKEPLPSSRLWSLVSWCLSFSPSPLSLSSLLSGL